jgi:hypothetical protein
VTTAVDSNVSVKLHFLVTQSIDVQGGRITNVPLPVAEHHSYTKRYVDDLVNKLKSLLGFVPSDPDVNDPAYLNIPPTEVSGLESSFRDQWLMKGKIDTQIAETKAVNNTLKSVIRNFTPTAMRDPFIFCGDHITLLIKEWVDPNGEP